MKYAILAVLLLTGCWKVGTVYKGVEDECLRSEQINSTGITTGGSVTFSSARVCMERAYYRVVKRYEGGLRWTYLEKTRCKSTLCKED